MQENATNLIWAFGLWALVFVSKNRNSSFVLTDVRRRYLQSQSQSPKHKEQRLKSIEIDFAHRFRIDPLCSKQSVHPGVDK
jgi:hypothetical protein